MKEITDQKRLELAYKKILQLEAKLDKSSPISDQNSGHIPVAVIGAACRYPQGVKTPQAMWQVFAGGKNGIKEIPNSRWEISEIFSDNRADPNKTYCKYGGFFDAIDEFDPLFFNISVKEAERMDPQQRLFLQGCWEALEDAGYSDARLNGTKCGVYVGSLNCDYTNILNATPHDLDLFELMGTQSSILSARISYLLNLKGPAVTIDTACSSSLIALDMAVKAIQRGDIDMALAGGVHLYITPNLYIMMSKAQMLSEDGQSKAFDNGANGFAPGEGMAAVMLKPLEKAMADGDQIYGVILGGASNQDGKTNGITAPNSLAQAELQCETYQRLGLSPETIGYIEAHGTGTKLGDPIEFEALVSSFRKFTSKEHFCALGSSKTNFGHTLSAAGITGVLKALLAMKNKKIPANLNFTSANEHLEFNASPFYINNTLVDWPAASHPRRSAVNSFGFSGTNVHLVLEEAPEIPRENKPVPPAHLILLGAKTPSALASKVRDLTAWLENSEEQLSDLALTLLRGRCHFKYRTGFIVANKNELHQSLANWQANNPATESTALDSLPSIIDALVDFEKLSAEEYHRQLHVLLNSYLAGENAEWHKLYQNTSARTVSAPTYPFENEKYWISPKKDSQALDADQSFSLLDTNESTLQAQCYQKTFTGNEFYLRDHLVNLRKMLPGVAYLEMARSSGNHCNAPHKVRRIRHVVWQNPIVVDGGPQTARISLHPNGDKVEFQVFSTQGENDKVTVHSRGVLEYDQTDAKPDVFINIEQLRGELSDFMSQRQCYDTFREKGLNYGSSFKRILNLCFKDNRALATLEGLELDVLGEALHPGIMDAALQAVLILLSQVVSNANQHYLPYTIDELEIHHPLKARCHSFVTRREKTNRADDAEYFDVILADETGKVLVTVSGLKLVPVQANVEQMTNRAESLFYRPSLLESAITPVTPALFATRFLGEDSNHQKPVLLIIGDKVAFPRCLDHALFQEFLPIIYVANAAEFSPLNKCNIEVNLQDPLQAERLINELARQQLAPEFVVWLSMDNPFSLDNSRVDQLQFKSSLIKQMILSKATHRMRFVSVQLSNESDAPYCAADSGFFKTLALENPNYIGKQMVLADPVDPRRTSQWLINEIFNDHISPQPVIYRQGRRFVQTLEKLATPDADLDLAQVIKKNGTYLITGGLRGIGLALARQIARQWDVNLILVGRQPPDANQKQQLQELQQTMKSGSVTYHLADVTCREDMLSLKDNIHAAHKGLNGVLHCAGVKRDAFILKKSAEDIAQVLRPKTVGTLLLDEITGDFNLDFFVMFSSIASVFGNPGQSDYAFANGFMDDFATYRSQLVTSGQRSGNTLSINWPLWKEGGMQLDTLTYASMQDVFGMQPIDARLGLQALTKSLQLPASNVMYMYGDPGKTDKALQHALGLADPSLDVDSKALDDGQRAKIQRESERFFKLLISDEMKIPVEKLDSTAPFEHFGMDSVVYMSLNSKLEHKFGKISKTLFYEYQNIAALAGYFVDKHLSKLLDLTETQLQGKAPPQALSKVETPPEVQQLPRFKHREASAHKNGDIAIIGLSGRYPQAKSLDEFWQNLVNGRDCIEEIPTARWHHDRYFDATRGTAGKTYSKWGGFIQDHDGFDALLFNVSPKEAALIDPQERWFLQTAWQALGDSGYTAKALASQKVGVYAGVMWSQYQLLGVDPDYHTEGSVPESLISSVANRVSYFFDFHGPSLGLDTMCSSSLTAIHMACEAINTGEIDVALAGGVNLIVHPNKYLRLAQGNFASSDGRCRSFGAGGNGYVPGEGVGVAILKPLARALADGDHIYGVIKSSHINHGGKTNGYTVPNPVQQGELIRHAMSKAQIHPESISYVEAHGTGTELGDPIEITGLTQAFSSQSGKRGYCALGSVKSNIGHLESAAGISAVTKILLQLKHDLLVPSLHCDTTNPNIDLDASPFVLQKHLSPWRESLSLQGRVNRTTRRAAVSSFGAGGANAHLIIEEAPEIKSRPATQAKLPRVFVFSARDKQRLTGYIRHMVAYLQKPETARSVPLADIAFTLQNGRDNEVERLAVVADSYKPLVDALNGFLDNSDAPGLTVLTGSAPGTEKSRVHLPSGDSGRDYINSLIKHGELEKIAALWVEGMEIDWQRLGDGALGCRTPLPMPPLQSAPYWIPRSNAHIGAPSQQLHPLIDANTSTLDNQTYSKRFTGQESWLKNHVILNQKLLPGSAFLEMALAAGKLAQADAIVCLEDIRWHAPLQLSNQAIDLNIQLHPLGDFIQFAVANPGGLEYCTGQLHMQPLAVSSAPTSGIHGNDLPAIDPQQTMAQMPNTLSATDFYAALASKGFQYRNQFCSLASLHYDQAKVIAPLASLEASNEEQNIYLVDAAFQSVVPLIQGYSDQPYVPATLGRLTLFDSSSQPAFVTASLIGQCENTGQMSFNLAIYNSQGQAMMGLQNFVAAPLTQAGEEKQTRNQVHYFNTGWTPAQTSAADVDANSRHCLLLDMGRQAPAGFAGVQLTPASQFEKISATAWALDPSLAGHWQQVFAQLEASSQEQDPYQLVINTGPSGYPRAAMVKWLSIFTAITQALGQQLPSRSLRILFAYYTCDRELNHHASISGLLKTLQQEHSRIRCSSLGFDANCTDSDIVTGLGLELGRHNTAALAGEAYYRQGRLHIKQLLPLASSAQPAELLRHKGVYLITGGAGGIGRKMAETLSHHYQARLVLTGRSPLNPAISQLLDRLKSYGSEAIYLTSDISNPAQTADLIEKSIARFGAINGVIHSAGITHDRYMLQKTADEFTAVLAPKIEGTSVLDEATSGLDLDFFMLCSSIAALLGNPGQSDYATANSFLNSFAEYRQQLCAAGKRKGKSLSIAWPYWAEGGMRLTPELIAQMEATTGLTPLGTKEAMTAVEFALQQASPLVIVASGNADQFALTAAGDVSDNGYGKESDNPLPEADAQALVSTRLRKLVAAETRWDYDKIVETENFGTYGVDSVMMLSLTQKLAATFGDLPKTLFFEYPNIRALSHHLVTHYPKAVIAMQTPQAAAQPLASRTEHKPLATKSTRRAHLQQGLTQRGQQQGAVAIPEPIAIIGLSGRYPGADSLDAFAENLAQGRDGIREIPSQRWDAAQYFDSRRQGAKGKTYSRWGGFIDGVDEFDPLFFNIAPADAITMDPQERLFLETSWHALEDAGYHQGNLQSTQVGVYVGVMWSHYQLHGVGTEPALSNKFPESSYASIANRVSYWFGFDGPSMAVDTMCSSSLTAIHLACEAIRRGECNIALAGGVNLSLHPYKYQQLSGSQFLSSDGRCRSFGEGGDGYVPGEGVGCLVLKPLSRALADKDQVYGVLRASRINHGGKSNGYHVPNPQAQAKLIQAAIEQSGVPAAAISYIETHGTGTPLGDPIELQGLKKAFSQLGYPASCPLGSVKSNIGHLEAASGIAGLTKVLLQMREGKLFPSLHSAELNPNLDLAGTPFRVQQQLEHWPISHGSRLAGVSSFGAGGSNAFLLVEQPAAAATPSHSPYPSLIIPLSARSESALQKNIQLLVAHLQSRAALQLADVAYTLQHGRAPMAERLALVVTSLDQLREKLCQILQGETPADVFRGCADHHAKGEWTPAARDLSQIAQAWVQGADLDFSQIFAELRARKISLPGYSFDRKRYWYKSDTSTAPAADSQPALPVAAEVFSLPLDVARSALSGLVFRWPLAADSRLLLDHQFKDQPLVPGVAQLLVASQLATYIASNPQKNQQISLQHISWLAPIFTENSRSLEVSLERNDQGYSYRICSQAKGDPLLHGLGTIAVAGEAHETLPQGIASIEAPLPGSIDGAGFYERFQPFAIDYQGAFRCITQARYSATEVLAEFSIAPGARSEPIGKAAALDALLQCFVLLQAQEKPLAKLPVAVASVRFLRPLPSSGYIAIGETRENMGNGVIFDGNRRPCAIFAGIQFRVVESPSLADAAPLEQQLQAEVIAIFSRKLNIPDAELKLHRRFESFGLESVMATAITSELRGLVPGLPSTLLFEYQTLGALCDYLLQDHRDEIQGYFRNTAPAAIPASDPAPETHEHADLETHPNRNLQVEKVKAIFAESLGMAPGDIKETARFDSYGLESVKSTEITQKLQNLYGPLPPTLLFEHQTIASLMSYLLKTSVASQPPVSDDHGSPEDEEDLRQKINQLSDSDVDLLLHSLLKADVKKEHNSYEC